mgnify:CR=1 FL=1
MNRFGWAIKPMDEGIIWATGVRKPFSMEAVNDYPRLW